MTISVSVNRSPDASSPSKLFTSRELAVLVLQKINAFSVNDTAPDPVELERTLEWMELNIAQLAGTRTCWWLTRYDLKFDLDANEDEYDLLEAFENTVPGQGVLFPIAAYLIDSSGNEVEIELVRSHKWLEEADRDQAGTPDRIHIGRDLPLKARPWPIPSASGYKIRLVLQTYAKSVLVKEGEQAGDAEHGFSQEWQRWIVHAAAADVGDGPVRRFPAADINRWRDIANDAARALQGFSNREKRSGIPRTEAYGA